MSGSVEFDRSVDLRSLTGARRHRSSVGRLLEWERLTSSTKRIIKVWLPSAIWLAVIVVESTNLGSMEHTGHILYPIFYFLFHMDLSRFDVWHAVLRKTGHVVGYFTLSVLFFRSWRATFPRLSTRWCFAWATVALLSTSLVATIDEWHQSYLPSRTGTVRDVILDTGAALLAQIALFVILRNGSARVLNAGTLRIDGRQN